MTVASLIELLQKMPAGHEVIVGVSEDVDSELLIQAGFIDRHGPRDVSIDCITEVAEVTGATLVDGTRVAILHDAGGKVGVPIAECAPQDIVVVGPEV